jgi:MFS transporter, DHA1 family, inner membrane transport protein
MPFALLLALSAANFVVGFGAFVVIGLVEPIATSYTTSPSVAGGTMTAYAIAYAIGSPLAVSLSGAMPRRLTLTFGMALFALGSLASALAPTMPLLFAARVVAAIGAGLFTPSAAAVAVALSPPDQRAKALSTVFAGLTIAQVAGVPAGTWLGYAYGPAATFALVTALALAATAIVFIMTPKEVRLAPTSLGALFGVLKTPHLMLAVTYSMTFLAAIYVVYTYLGPLLTALYGLDRDAKTVMFLIYGSAAVLGNFVGAWSVGRFGAGRTLLFLAVVQVVMLYLVPELTPGPTITAILLFVWALAGWSFLTPQQTRLVAIGPTQVQSLFALNASCIYAAAAIGSAIGGATIRTGGYDWLGIIAALMGVLAIGHFLASERLNRTQTGRAIG